MLIKYSSFWSRTLFAGFRAILLAGVFNPGAALCERGDARGGNNVTAAGSTRSLQGEAAIAHLKQDGAYESLGETVAATRYSINQIQGTSPSGENATYEALNPAHALRAEFTGSGVVVRSNGGQSWQIGLQLKSYGYGQQLVEVPPLISRHVSGNRIEYKRQKSEVRGQIRN